MDSWAGLLILLLLFILVGIAIYAIPWIIINWKLYNKAHQPGWAAIVPYYNIYIFGAVGKAHPAAIFGLIAVNLLNYAVPSKYSAFMGAISLALGIYLLVKFIRQFKGSVAFWVWYIIFPLVALFLEKNVSYAGDTVPMGGTGAGAAPAPVMGGPVPVAPQPITNPMPPTQPIVSPPEQPATTQSTPTVESVTEPQQATTPVAPSNPPTDSTLPPQNPTV